MLAGGILHLSIITTTAPEIRGRGAARYFLSRELQLPSETAFPSHS